MPSRIFARSPYVIQIDVPDSSSTKIELRIWNGSGSEPTNPTYTISKLVPSSSNFLTEYNISPYIREFINHNIKQNVYDGIYSTPNSQWCNIHVKASADSTLIIDEFYYGFDGYGYYENGFNPDLGNISLDLGTYYYPFDINVNPAINQLYQAGHISLNSSYDFNHIKYIQLENESEAEISPLNSFQDIPCVYPDFYPYGNKVQFLLSGEIVKEFIFKPITECYYEVLTIDFVNRYGAWQRTFLYKAQYNYLDVQNTEYKMIPTAGYGANYDLQEGQIKTFNTNGIKSIKGNTGWVDESYFGVIQQLILSERILLNNLPVKMKTKSIEKVNSLNQNLINYTLEFDYSFNVINNVL